MPTYDCRKDGCEPGAISFPCNVRILDPQTGEQFPGKVFYVRTSPARIGRFPVDARGEPLVDRSKRLLTTADNPRLIVSETADGLTPVTHAKAILRGADLKFRSYARLEVWEDRPWVAVAVDTGEVIARSDP